MRRAGWFAACEMRAYHPVQPCTGGVIMLIRDILNLKGSTIHSVAPETSLEAAVDLMVRHDIGSLVVMRGTSMAGMLTFREVLEALQRGRGSIGGMCASDVMVMEPTCGRPDQTIDELRHLMTLHHVRYLPVLEDGKLVGIVSFHDVAKAVIKETSMENRLLKRYIESQPSEQAH
jgi:CBS domain-containing protein